MQIQFIDLWKEYQTYIRSLFVNPNYQRQIIRDTFYYAAFLSTTRDFLVSCWDAFGLDDLYLQLSDHLTVQEDSADALKKARSFRNAAEHLSDFLHLKYKSYRELPFITFPEDYDGFVEATTSSTDYDVIYTEILSIDEELSPLIDYVKQIKPPQRREFDSLIESAQEGNSFAKNRIFEMYMRVAIRIALQYCKHYPLSLSDTIQDALLGLHTAIDRYDNERHGPFLTYFPFWVRNTLQRNAYWSRIPFSVPAHLSDKLFTVYDLKEQHCCELCKDERVCPNLVNEISIALNVDNKESLTLIKCFDETLSIEELLECENDPRIDDMQQEYVLSDRGEFAERMDEEHHKARMEQTVYDTIVTKLSERQAKVIVLRYGLEDGITRTLEEVAQSFNLTRERIRQIEAKALRKLKHCGLQRLTSKE